MKKKERNWFIERIVEVQQVIGLFGIINFFLLIRLSIGEFDPLIMIIVILAVIIFSWFMDKKIRLRSKIISSHAKENELIIEILETVKELKRLESDKK